MEEESESFVFLGREIFGRTIPFFFFGHDDNDISGFDAAKWELMYPQSTLGG